jgi:hypothetical protein
MNNESMRSHEPGQYQDDEISLLDIVNFFSENLKKLLIAALVGGFLGLGVWYFLVDYKAQLIVNNTTSRDTNIKDTNKRINFDVVSFKVLQKTIPLFISQIVSEQKIPEGQERLYRAMSDESFWLKNVTPNYAISKVDSKEFATLSKELESASTYIVSLNFSGKGKTKEDAIQSVKAAEYHFLRDGAYLQIKTLMEQYDSKLFYDKIEINKRLGEQQIELGYLEEKLKNLELLRKEYPTNVVVQSQVVDPKDSGAKYFPIGTQIIAINNDINQIKENISRLNDSLNQLNLIEKFYSQARPILRENYDGIDLSNKILEILSGLKKDIPADDVKLNTNLLKIQDDFSRIQNLFTKELVRASEPSTKKQGFLISVMAGAVIGGIIMLLFLLVTKSLNSIKSNKTAEI